MGEQSIQGGHWSGKSRGNLNFLQVQGKVVYFCKMVREILNIKIGNFLVFAQTCLAVAGIFMFPPTKGGGRGGGTYCFLDGWSYLPLFYLKKISCPLCNLNTLWNISVVLGRNVEQDQTTCRVQEWQLCHSYFWLYLPLLYLTVRIYWFRVHSVCLRPFGIFLWYLVEM